MRIRGARFLHMGCRQAICFLSFEKMNGEKYYILKKLSSSVNVANFKYAFKSKYLTGFKQWSAANQFNKLGGYAFWNYHRECSYTHGKLSYQHFLAKMLSANSAVLKAVALLFGSFVIRVVIALRATGGEAAVLQTLARARDAYLSRMHANSAADELAALFAECVIAESLPKATLPSSGTHDMQQPAPNILPHSVQATSGFEHDTRMESIVGCDEVRAPILAESGRMQILIDAASDGSSFICLHCGGLVSNLRRDEHIAHWCSDAYMM